MPLSYIRTVRKILTCLNCKKLRTKAGSSQGRFKLYKRLVRKARRPFLVRPVRAMDDQVIRGWFAGHTIHYF